MGIPAMRGDLRRKPIPCKMPTSFRMDGLIELTAYRILAWSEVIRFRNRYRKGAISNTMTYFLLPISLSAVLIALVQSWKLLVLRYRWKYPKSDSRNNYTH